MKSVSISAFLLLCAGAAILFAAEEVTNPAPVMAEETVSAPSGAKADTSGAPAPGGAAVPQPAAASEGAAAPQPPAPSKGGAAAEADIKPLMQTVKNNFKQENYEAALKAVEMALALKPNDSEAIKYRGMIQFRLNNLPGAEIYLKLAQTAGVKDAELVFYLGALYDRKGDFVAAEKEFLRHTEFSPFNPYAGKMKKYAAFVGAKAAKQRAKAALTQEASLDVSRIAPNSVTVVAFTNTGTNKDLDPLQKGLAEMIATDLSQVEDLNVIERVQMQVLVNEMALGQSGLLEAENAKRAGRLAGAEKVINGSFGSDDGVTFRMDAGMADARTGDLKAVAPQSGKLEDIFFMEKALVIRIIDEMGIVLTDKERKKINNVPTQNVMAFLAYSRGLDAEDKGDFGSARAAYADAAKADPKFAAARAASVSAGIKADCAKAADLTQVKLSTEAPAPGEEITTPVFTIGGLSFSARGWASLFTLNSAIASFMPEKAITASKALFASDGGLIPLSSGTIERISYLDAFNYGFGAGSKSLETRVPIPDDGL